MIQIGELGDFECKKEIKVATQRIEIYANNILVASIACETVDISQTFGRPDFITLYNSSNECIGYYFDTDKTTIRIIKIKEDEHYGTPKTHGSI